jgi:uncharacterized membrane protein
VPRPLSEYRSQANRSVRPLLFWVASVAIITFILLLVLAAPLAAASHYPHVALTIYRSFSSICHQLPERSFFIAGRPFAVCARCTGIYGGFALLLVLYPLIRPLRSTYLPPPKWLFLAAVPLTIDFGLTFLRIWENTHMTRFLTGMLLGGVTVFYVMPGLAELSERVGRRKTTSLPGSSFTLGSTETVAPAPSDYSAPERRI